MAETTYVLVLLLFSNARMETVIGIEMQAFTTEETCKAAAEGITKSRAFVQWRCEPQ
ncbi:hypothetical protein [Pseudoruegeria sp. HB172150]|uniref:hypothetical protein n=1 Tax=Pseudoruegeria sp. HB172150 TaxID=2721164 RepID=UPI0015530255|nr:hypothetical protein [Pseudoruegeria sp. HB172150]